MVCCIGKALFLFSLLLVCSHGFMYSLPSKALLSKKASAGIMKHSIASIGRKLHLTNNIRGRYQSLDIIKLSAGSSASLDSSDYSSPDLKNEGLKIELRQFSKFLQSAAWFSWWCQLILNTVAGVILFFTNAFVQPGGMTRNVLSNGYVFAAAGLALGAISIFWTWGFTGVAKRIRRSVLEPPSSMAMIRRVVRTAIFVNLLGLCTALIGAEQFVGNLMARVLSQQGFTPLVVSAASNPSALASPTVQPVDIFVIQANTNILLSHFISLVTSLVLLLRYSKLN